MITLEEFNELVSELEQDTKYQSSFTSIMQHPNFEIMKKLGHKLIPFLINRLKTDPHWWVILLLGEIIDNPPEYPEESRGVFKDIIKIWLDHLTTKNKE